MAAAQSVLMTSLATWGGFTSAVSSVAVTTSAAFGATGFGSAYLYNKL